MIHRNLIVIGASAGGIEAIREILRALPSDLDAAVLVVLHTSNHSGSTLPQIFSRAGKLPVAHARDRDLIEKGRVYIAQPDCHMIVDGNTLRVLRGPRENLHRPAIDPLFRSAAASYGRRVIGVVLTGLLDDGTSGLMVIRARGGTPIVQDPATAMFDSMPASALEQVPDALVLPLEKIGAELARLVSEPLPQPPSQTSPKGSEAERETRIAELDMPEIEREDRQGQPSAFACPDCGGVLWEIEDHGFLRFRCRVGHAFTARHLRAEQQYAVETALWSALRALEESASLYRRMAERASGFSHDRTAKKYEERAENLHQNAHTLREFLVHVNQNGDEPATV